MTVRPVSSLPGKEYEAGLLPSWMVGHKKVRSDYPAMPWTTCKSKSHVRDSCTESQRLTRHVFSGTVRPVKSDLTRHAIQVPVPFAVSYLLIVND